MARFQITVTATYTIPDRDLVACYGTTDLSACARIDAAADPLDMLTGVTGRLTSKVEAITDGPSTDDDLRAAWDAVDELPRDGMPAEVRRLADAVGNLLAVKAGYGEND